MTRIKSAPTFSSNEGNRWINSWQVKQQSSRVKSRVSNTVGANHRPIGQMGSRFGQEKMNNRLGLPNQSKQACNRQNIACK